MARFPPWRATAGAALAALPWLSPMAEGPSAAVQPWLVSMGCVLALWLVTATGGTAPRPRLVWPCVAVVLWALLSQGSIRPDIAFLAGGLALVTVSAGISSEPHLSKALQAGFLFAAAASAFIGLVQYFGASAAFAPWMSQAGVGEAYANLRQPNQYATLCWIGVAIVLFGTLRLSRPASVALVVLLAAGSAASVSRTAMLQAAVLVTLAAWWPAGRRSRLLLCGLATATFIASVWALPALVESITGVLPERTVWARLGGTEGCASRLVLWSNVLHLIALKPLTGWGWGELDYAHYLTLYAGPRFCEILDNAHNLPLHLAVELGVPVALLASGGAILWAWRQRPWSEAAPLRQLAWVMLALVLLHSMLEYPAWYGSFQMALGVALGWLLPRREELAPSIARWRGGAGVAAMLAATAYAAWDYDRVSQIYTPPEQRRPFWRDDTLEHARASWLFAGQARFAELTLSSPTRANAERMYVLANQVLHYSPEPRVVERAVESATLVGREDEAVLHLARFRAAFPREYEAWREAQRRPLPP